MSGAAHPDRVAWVDATAGVAGDMLLGALLDLGADLGAVRRAVAAVAGADVSIAVAAAARHGLRATRALVQARRSDPPQRAWSDVRVLLAGADLDDRVRAAALAVFERLAVAEARAHGVPPDEVHFHELGALDSIADVVGVCAALHDLAWPRLICSPIALGSGTVRTAHGELPVPAPAVLELAAGRDVLPGGPGERATPTGVALLAELSVPGPLPAARLVAVGVGAGERDTSDRPNVVRVVLGEPDAPDGTQVEDQVLLEANVDDLDPRVWPGVLAALLDAGARDAWLTPILMKKGRPGHTVHLLAAAPDGPRLRQLVIEQTSTIGVRSHPVSRHALARTWAEVDVDGVPVRVKLAHRDGLIVRAAVEFDDAAAAARRLARPVLAVLAAAEAAAAAAGLAPGQPLP